MPANAFAAIRPIRRVQRSVGRVRVRRSGPGVYRRCPPYPYGRIMPANAFAAIRPIRRLFGVQ